MTTPTMYGSIEGRNENDPEGHELEVETDENAKQRNTYSICGHNHMSHHRGCHRMVLLTLMIMGLVLMASIVYDRIDPNHSISSAWNAYGIATKNVSRDVDGKLAATTEHFFHHQYINHLIDPPTTKTGTFVHRYYERTEYFGGPGYPIFIIMGGEDPLEGLLYPFVYNHLAQTFRGYTAALEHRFFGKSLPIEFPSHDELHTLLTPNQALWDAVRFIQYKRKELGCSLERNHPDYCPVISVGGSYPGFLSSLMRTIHSDVVDIGYGSSAPFRLYSHHTDQYAYYDKITATADSASPGCADAVRTTLYDAQEDIVESLDEQLQDVAVTYGICRGSVPAYIQTTDVLAQELMLIIATHFANGNMDYYPPGPQQDFVKGCTIFQNPNLKMTEDKIKAYLLMGNDDSDCFDMMTELPPGPNGTISSSDWSGVGAGPEGYYWDYISCQLIPECGFSDESMFPPRQWNLQWVKEHCMNRFDWNPDPLALNRQFGFDDLSKVTRLLLTNGIVDGWSISSILDENVAPGVEVINMVNVSYFLAMNAQALPSSHVFNSLCTFDLCFQGAHHSDLSHVGPTPNDTPDVKEAFLRITSIIADWLDEVRTTT
jgi:Serine carboxypeptidase S28